MGSWDVAFLPSETRVYTAFLNGGKVRTLRPPHVLRLLLEVSKSMLPVNTFATTNLPCVS